MRVRLRKSEGFTLVELLMVMVIIAILVGLILGTAGYIQKGAARKRAATEIAAMEAAMESYKADNGIYPRNSATDGLDARAAAATPAAAASKYLYGELSGDRDFDRKVDPGAKQYMEFKPNMLLPSGGTTVPVTALIDPFGVNYGYSTANQKDVEDGKNPPAKGYNPTFDLWSTTGSNDPAKWVTNW